MQCPQCDFENMPGMNVCFRCGSTLVAEGPVDISPPRAAAWKKPFRFAVRTARRFSAVQQIEARAEAAADRAGNWLLRMPGRPSIPWESARDALSKAARGFFMAFPVSVIPGLAQAIDRRFRKVRLYVIVWGASLLAGIFMFGSVWGVALLSTAVCMHAWIMADAALPEGTYKKIGGRLACLTLAMGAVYLIYQGLYGLSPLAFGQAGIAVKPRRVELRDMLLCVKKDGYSPSLRRGDLALFVVRGARYERQGVVVGQVVGLPGDKVSREAGDRFTVNGVLLDPEIYPVPAHMRAVVFSEELGPDSYFITIEYNVQRRGDANLYRQAVVQTAVYSSNDIAGRAVMRWLPLSRRGFLPETE